MTALRDLFLARITATGPITLADYMADCLLHPVHGYYTTRDPLGVAGDFTTAPEISQMFGELIGLALAQTWLDQGAPAQIALTELGPGRGTLMADALRATRGIAGFHDALTVHFVEASPGLRKKQAALIPDAAWHDDIGTLPDVPLFLVANEFFDALPVRQFTRDPQGWREHMVGVVDSQLALGLSQAAPIDTLAHRLADTGHGDVVEICPALPAIVGHIAAQIDTYGGAALIIDYGDWQSKGDTFQALADHQMVNPFTAPGHADLTAHVDFAAIATASRTHTQMTPQGVFLERLGITARAQTLARGLTDAALASHIEAHRRLTHPDAMGALFKVIGLYPTSHQPPAGLDP